MSRANPKSCQESRRAETELRKILTRDGLQAFELLCQKGCDREVLAVRILWLRGPRPQRKRKLQLSFNYKECKRLSKLCKRLARDLQDFHEDPRRVSYANLAPQSPATSQALVFTLKPSLRAYKTRPPVDPLDSLCAQLRVASSRLAELANRQRPAQPMIVQIDNFSFYLKWLVDYVKQETGKAHNAEIAILCAAIGHQLSEDALKQSAYRARSERR
jgi:hypothetical protein